MTSQSERYERLRPLLAPIVSLALIGLAGLVIHAFTKDVRVHEIKAAVAAVSAPRVVLAIVFTAMSFSALAILDVLAVRSVAPGVVSDRRAAIAGALGYAISNVLGFGVVTGGALRYRIYSAEGLDAADVLRVTTTSYLAFWFGIATVARARSRHRSDRSRPGGARRRAGRDRRLASCFWVSSAPR